MPIPYSWGMWISLRIYHGARDKHSPIVPKSVSQISSVSLLGGHGVIMTAPICLTPAFCRKCGSNNWCCAGMLNEPSAVSRQRGSFQLLVPIVMLRVSHNPLPI